MNFKQALEEMKKGSLVKLPNWNGYWAMDNFLKELVIKTKDNIIWTVEKSINPHLTLSSMESDEWEVYQHNFTNTGMAYVFDDETLMTLETAIKYIKGGVKDRTLVIHGSDCIYSYPVYEKEKVYDTTPLFTFEPKRTIDNIDRKCLEDFDKNYMELAIRNIIWNDFKIPNKVTCRLVRPSTNNRTYLFTDVIHSLQEEPKIFSAIDHDNIIIGFNNILQKITVSVCDHLYTLDQLEYEPSNNLINDLFKYSYKITDYDDTRKMSSAILSINTGIEFLKEYNNRFKVIDPKIRLDIYINNYELIMSIHKLDDSYYSITDINGKISTVMVTNLYIAVKKILSRLFPDNKTSDTIFTSQMYFEDFE